MRLARRRRRAYIEDARWAEERMAKQRSGKGGEGQAGQAPWSPRLGRPAGTNRQLARQTRKLLGRHYAAKYPGRRSG